MGDPISELTPFSFRLRESPEPRPGILSRSRPAFPVRCSMFDVRCSSLSRETDLRLSHHHRALFHHQVLRLHIAKQAACGPKQDAPIDAQVGRQFTRDLRGPDLNLILPAKMIFRRNDEPAGFETAL